MANDAIASKANVVREFLYAHLLELNIMASAVSTVLFCQIEVLMSWSLNGLPVNYSFECFSTMLACMCVGSHGWSSCTFASHDRNSPYWWILCWVSSTLGMSNSNEYEDFTIKKPVIVVDIQKNLSKASRSKLIQVRVNPNLALGLWILILGVEEELQQTNLGYCSWRT